MSIEIRMQDPKNDDYIDMRNMLISSIREKFEYVNIYEYNYKQKKKNKITYNHDFYIYIGFNVRILQDVFNTLVEKKSKIILYNLPGTSFYEDLIDLLDKYIDYDEKIPYYKERIFDTWNHREIISYLNVSYRKREEAAQNRLERKLKLLNSVNNEELPDDQLLIADNKEDTNLDELIF